MRRLHGAPPADPITIDFEGEPIPAREGEPIACSLLAAGVRVFSRSVKYHRPRGPFCFSAACTHCLMRVDGVPNVYSCREPARAGMRIERQNAFPSAKLDVFAVNDWLFPHGFDHHEMLAGIPVAETVMAKVARHLAGLGKLPEGPAKARPDAERIRTQVAIAGGGAAGLGAAQVLAARGLSFVTIERERELGGTLASTPLTDIPPPSAFPPGTIRTLSTAFGLYEDEGGWFLSVTQLDPSGPRLLQVYADRFLLAVGGHPQLLVFENNDIPGVFAGRAIERMVRRHRLLPGERVALVGAGPSLYATARILTEAGGAVAAIVDAEEPPSGERALRGTPVKAHGRTRVTALTFERSDGTRQKVACDAIGVCLPPAPSFELARQAGARVAFDDRRRVFRVESDADGRTAHPAVFVAGDALGPGSVQEAYASGRRAAVAIADELGARQEGAP